MWHIVSVIKERQGNTLARPRRRHECRHSICHELREQWFADKIDFTGSAPHKEISPPFALGAAWRDRSGDDRPPDVRSPACASQRRSVEIDTPRTSAAALMPPVLSILPKTTQVPADAIDALNTPS